MLTEIDAEEAVRGLDIESVVKTVERGFRIAGNGAAFIGGRLHIPVPSGGFHIVAGGLAYPDRPIIVTKVNGRFDAANGTEGRARMQGVILVSSATDGLPIALVGSAGITALRTSGVAAVAAKHLAVGPIETALVVGTGAVARSSAFGARRGLSALEAPGGGSQPIARQRHGRRNLSCRTG